ncbi:MAG TPA: galactokinase [Firmicutes bacterium]|nr:galactokinase [Bacillota bacterium]
MILTSECKEEFESTFFYSPSYYFFSHGRLEILGNHTDHNHGLCLVSSVDMGITAAVNKDDNGFAEIYSSGYKPIKFPISSLERKEEEKGTSLSLCKGVLSKCKELGYKIGGFKAYFVSDIFPGAGVSSSACYESLIVKIISTLYNDDKISSLEMAKIGKYAENVYFGKPCGLLDQIGTSFGGVIYVDFASLEEPVLENINFDLPLKIILINSGGSHAQLTPLYASIGLDMKSVAQNVFDKPYLRLVSPKEYFMRIAMPNNSVSERAKLRATHFFNENERVLKAKKALSMNDATSFVDCINASSLSSQTLLCNTMVPGHYEGSPQQAIDRLRPFAKEGGIRIMGGGFAGSIIAFVYPKDFSSFMSAAISLYGKNNVKSVSILKDGPSLIR